MEERQSRLSSMVWRRFQQYFCVRLIPQNSMFSNFCHVLKHFTNESFTSNLHGHKIHHTTDYPNCIIEYFYY